MINENEKLLIRELRKNSRVQLTEISETIKMPITTIFGKLKKISPIIIKNTSLLNFKKLSFPLTIIYTIKIKDSKKIKFLNFINNQKNINNIFRLSGSFNILIEAIFKDMNEAYNFEENILEFKPNKLKEYPVINEIKKEEFYT